MSEDADGLEFPLSVTGLGKYQSDLEKAAGSTERLGKKSEAARLGVWGMGEAAENAAQRLGVPNQMARQLGNSVETLVSRLGMGTMALTGVAFAAMAGVAAWNYYQEAQRKAREETMKASDAAMKWIDSARIGTTETKALAKAKDDLWQVEKDRASFNLKHGLADQAKRVQEAAEKASKAFKENEVVDDIVTRRIFGTRESRQKAYDTALLDLREAQKKLQVMVAENAEVDGTGTLGRNKPKETKPFADDYNAEVEYLKSTDALWMTQDKNYAAHVDMQLAIFDAQSSAKLNKISTEGASIQRIKDEYQVMEVQRMGIMASEEDRLRDEKARKDKQAAIEKQQLTQMGWSYGVQIAQGLTALAAQHGKKDAEEQKKAARMMAIVNTAAGITKALATKGWAGAAEAALIAAMGAIQISTINSASYGGGGSGSTLNFGGGSAGSDNYKYFNYEQSTYGSGWRPGEGQGSVTNIYAMDSKSFETYMMENAGSVAKANAYAEKGYA